MDKIRAHTVISGKVQGVFFRISTKNIAKKIGITGWVRNLPTGEVEAVFEGEKNAVEKIVAWAKRGPLLARVDKLEVKWEDYQGEFRDFVIRYD